MNVPWVTEQLSFHVFKSFGEFKRNSHLWLGAYASLGSTDIALEGKDQIVETELIVSAQQGATSLRDMLEAEKEAN